MQGPLKSGGRIIRGKYENHEKHKNYMGSLFVYLSTRSRGRDMFGVAILIGVVIPVEVIVGAIVCGLCDNKRIAYKAMVTAIFTILVTFLVL